MLTTVSTTKYLFVTIYLQKHTIHFFCCLALICFIPLKLSLYRSSFTLSPKKTSVIETHTEFPDLWSFHVATPEMIFNPSLLPLI